MVELNKLEKKDDGMQLIKDRISMLRNLRRPKQRKFDCPICQVRMKRKGKKGRDFFKCPKCKGKLMGALFIQAPSKESIDLQIAQTKIIRKENSKRKFIIEMKKEKYRGFDAIEFAGDYIRFDDYDKDGISFEEKKRLQEERAKRLEEQKKVEAKKKRTRKRAKKTEVK